MLYTPGKLFKPNQFLVDPNERRLAHNNSAEYNGHVSKHIPMVFDAAPANVDIELIVYTIVNLEVVAKVDEITGLGFGNKMNAPVYCREFR